MSIETAMILALAEIDRELGLPEDGCNSTARTLNAIRLLHCAHRDDVVEITSLKGQLERAHDGREQERRDHLKTQICYKGFAYNVRSQFGIDSLKQAIKDAEHG